MNTPVDMETIRNECVERIIAKIRLAKTLGEFVAECEHSERIANHGRRDFNADVAALGTVTDAIAKSIRDDIWLDVEQLATLFARDVIADTVRTSGGMEPIVWLTGNRYVPAYRSFEEIEAIYQEDDGTYIHELWERIEAKALALSIFIGYPDYDNCIYGVDMAKWEQSEASLNDEEIEDLNDEWTAIDPEPDTSSADEARGYVLTVDRLLEASQGDFKIATGDTVQFKTPNQAAGLEFTVTGIGRDSDGDVWVKVNNDEPPFFDWADILIRKVN